MTKESNSERLTERDHQDILQVVGELSIPKSDKLKSILVGVHQRGYKKAKKDILKILVNMIEKLSPE